MSTPEESELRYRRADSCVFGSTRTCLVGGDSDILFDNVEYRVYRV